MNSHDGFHEEVKLKEKALREGVRLNRTVCWTFLSKEIKIYLMEPMGA